MGLVQKRNRKKIAKMRVMSEGIYKKRRMKRKKDSLSAMKSIIRSDNKTPPNNLKKKESVNAYKKVVFF